MSENPKVKLTVLKVPRPEEVFDKMPLTLRYNGPCPYLKVGQEFIVDSESKPEGLCDFAWNALWPYVMTIRRGGDFSDMYEEAGKGLGCYPDAVRPVAFLMERF
jgi:uncharacterized repeat protein (TIGR04076 family)